MENNKDLESKKTKKANQSKKGTLVGFICCVVVFVCCFLYLEKTFLQEGKQNEAMEELQEQIQLPVEKAEVAKAEELDDSETLELTQEGMQAAVQTPAETEDDIDVLEEESLEIEEEPIYADVSVIDFQKLTNTNADIYAWLQVPGTNINYPVLQHPSDNSYYLNYNLDGSKGYPGCIYTEFHNAKDFMDFNTVIYGHNMKNGTMFHDVHLFEDSNFFDSHNRAYVYLPEKTLVYEIYAAYTYDNRHILASFDNFKEDDVKASYLESIKNIKDLGAHFRPDVEVVPADHIITLSTCVANQADKRYLVQAVLIDEIH